MMQQIFLVFIGGGAGAVIRWGIGLGVRCFVDFNFPIATFLSNVVSCVILTCIIQFGIKSSVSDSIKLLLITGLCGGLSTFSTFSYETVQLIKSGSPGWALLNVLLNIVCCTAIVFWALRK